MNRLLPILLLGLLWSQDAIAADALVGTPQTATPGAAPTMAYTIIGTSNFLLTCLYNDAGDNMSVSDTKLNTWTAVTAKQSGQGAAMQCYYAITNGTGADTISCLAQFGDNVRCAVAEFSGTLTASLIDTSSFTSAASGTAMASGSFTTSATDLLIGWGQSVNGSAPVVNGSWSLATSDVKTILEYQNAKTAGAYNATATAAGSATWEMLGFGVKDAGGGGGPACSGGLLLLGAGRC